MAYRFGALAAISLLTITTALTLSTASRASGASAGGARAVDSARSPAGVPRSATAFPGRGGRTVMSVAHRGASAYAPENTLPAVRLGQAQGADLVEVDVHQTRDNVLVVMHDGTLKRTTNAEKVFPDRGPWRISDFTYAEIQKLDAGAWFDSSYDGERVPTLDQVLDTLEKGSAGLLLEVKSPSRYPGIEVRVAAHLAERALRWSVDGRPMLVCSFDWDFIKRFKPLMPTVKVAVIGTPEYDTLPSVATYADLVNPKFGTASASYLERVHELGMESYGWTVDDPDDMRELISIGADGVVSNKPDVLDDVLDRERTGTA